MRFRVQGERLEPNRTKTLELVEPFGTPGTLIYFRERKRRSFSLFPHSFISHQRRLRFLVSSTNHHPQSWAAQARTRARRGEITRRPAARPISQSTRSRS